MKWPSEGVAVQDEFHPRTTATDGVIAVPGTLYRVELAEAAAKTTARLEREGTSIAAAVEIRPVRASVVSGEPMSDVVVVVRPAAPLAADSTYTLILELVGSSGELRTEELAVTVTGGPLGPLVPPAATLTLSPAQLARDPVCCEGEASSCGETTHCFARSHEVLPRFIVQPKIEAPLSRNTLVWIARVGRDGELEWIDEDVPARERLEWSVTFEEVQREYCVVLGLTSLIDGTTVMAEPMCAPVAETGAPRREPATVDMEYAEAVCLTPLVDVNGQPYVAEESGCSIVGAPGLLILPALLRRRRGARAVS